MSKILIVSGIMLIMAPFAWNIKTSIEKSAESQNTEVKTEKKDAETARAQTLSPIRTSDQKKSVPMKNAGDRCAKHEKAIEKASNDHKVAPVIIKSVIKVESGCRETAKGSAGEKGLMQIKDNTARGLGTNPAHLFDPEVNVKTGTKHIAELSKQFNSVEEWILAYNRGAGGARSYLRSGAHAGDHWHVKKVLAQIEREREKMPKY